MQTQRSQKPDATPIHNANETGRIPFTLFGAVFLIVFTLYVLTLAPGVVGGDAGEHQLAVPLLGIPHTTGYPLYILVGKLWTVVVPIGSMAWRMNLFSALGGALAAGTTALVIYRLAKDRSISKINSPWAGAVVGGITLSYGLTLWQWSTIAGIRSFNVFFLCPADTAGYILGQLTSERTA